MVTVDTVKRTPAEIDEGEVTALASRLEGTLLQATDAAYEDARKIWNGTIDRRPALIATCKSTNDVAEAVRFATRHDLLVSVCGGGHNVAGLAVSDGGLMIDLREMRQVTVDAATSTVTAQGGAQLGDIDPVAQSAGLVVPIGVASETGIAGLTLGGGMGWVRRKYGLTCDNLLRATVVTAGGEVVTASADENPDLLWALKGGGGNFGVVTEFQFRAYPVGPEVTFCLVAHPIEKAREGLQLFRSFAENAPDEMSAFAILWSVPHADDFPKEHQGKPTLIFAAAWIGDPSEGEKLFEPLRTFTEPYADLSGPVPYLDLQQLFDADYPKGARYYWKSNHLASLSDEVIDILVERTLSRPSPESTLDVWQLGGAISRVPEGATPYPHREAPYLLGIEANWHHAEDDAANQTWARDVFATMRKHSYKDALYVNFPGNLEEGDDLVRKAYGANYDRLAEVKRKYDPDNRFRLNSNIKP